MLESNLTRQVPGDDLPDTVAMRAVVTIYQDGTTECKTDFRAHEGPEAALALFGKVRETINWQVENRGRCPFMRNPSASYVPPIHIPPDKSIERLAIAMCFADYQASCETWQVQPRYTPEQAWSEAAQERRDIALRHAQAATEGARS